jgi:hypothetical protein
MKAESFRLHYQQCFSPSFRMSYGRFRIKEVINLGTNILFVKKSLFSSLPFPTIFPFLLPLFLIFFPFKHHQYQLITTTGKKSPSVFFLFNRWSRHVCFGGNFFSASWVHGFFGKVFSRSFFWREGLRPFSQESHRTNSENTVGGRERQKLREEREREGERERNREREKRDTMRKREKIQLKNMIFHFKE